MNKNNTNVLAIVNAIEKVASESFNTMVANAISKRIPGSSNRSFVDQDAFDTPFADEEIAKALAKVALTDQVALVNEIVAEANRLVATV